VVWTVVCMLICTLASGGMESCMHVNMCIGIWWYGRYVCMLICTLVSGGMDGCIYFNMHIGIWWYGKLYVC